MRVRERVPKVERVPGVSEGLPSEPENRPSARFPGAPAQARPGGSHDAGRPEGGGFGFHRGLHTVWGGGGGHPERAGHGASETPAGPHDRALRGNEGESVNGHGPANCTLTAHGGAAMRMRG